MVSGAVLRERFSNPINFVVADGTGIEKGRILKLTDARTASAVTSGAGATTLCPIAGIAAREKVASDGRTRLAVYRDGIFDIPASGAIAAGSAVVGVADSFVAAAPVGTTAASGAIVMGTALETATDYETIQVLVRL